MAAPSNGSGLFAGNRKVSTVRILTISLLALGAILAILYAYLQYAKPPIPDVISKDDAIQIALKAGNWDKWNRQKATGERQIEATLVHLQANGFSLKVDEKTLQDVPVAGGKFEGRENQYLWSVSIFAPDNNGNRNTNSLIDAKTGEVLLQY